MLGRCVVDNVFIESDCLGRQTAVHPCGDRASQPVTNKQCRVDETARSSGILRQLDTC